MTFTTTKLTELPLMKITLPHLTSYSHHHYSSLFSSSSTSKKPSLLIPKIPVSSSLKANKTTPKPTRKTPTTPSSSSPWLSKWPPTTPNPPVHAPPKFNQSNGQTPTQHSLNRDKGQNAIERIVLRLRNLGLGSDDEEDKENESDGGDELTRPVTGEETLGDLLKREWVRPDTIFIDEKGDDEYEVVLPWEMEEERETEAEGNNAAEGKRTVKAPTLAELTVEDEELRRLRRMGMFLRERISVAKAGLTNEVLEKIHDKWRKEELVRLKFHEVLARDMKTAHEIVEVALYVVFVCFG